MSWRVTKERCGRCLFGPDPLVPPARRAEVLAECRENGTTFLCHRSTLRGDKVTCRAFYDQPERLLPELAHVAKVCHERGFLPGAVEFVEYDDADPA